MCKWILDNWSYKYTLVFIFANTSAEHEKTYEFVHKCDKEFGLNLIWIEALIHPEKSIGTSYTITNFKNAKRNYEIFEEVYKKYGVANKSWIHCNREMKLNPIHSYATEVMMGGGVRFRNYSTAIGIRVDEIDRMDNKKDEKNFLYPLVKNIPMTKQMVRDWWGKQSFDLEIPEHHGNCMVCHKKSKRKLMTIALEDESKFIPIMNLTEKYKHVSPIEGEIRAPYRKNQTAQDIIRDAKKGGFKIFTDKEAVDSQLDLIGYDEYMDLDVPCGLDCSST